jgi:hypothetical protein
MALYCMFPMSVSVIGCGKGSEQGRVLDEESPRDLQTEIVQLEGAQTRVAERAAQRCMKNEGFSYRERPANSPSIITQYLHHATTEDNRLAVDTRHARASEFPSPRTRSASCTFRKFCSAV